MGTVFKITVDSSELNEGFAEIDKKIDTTQTSLNDTLAFTSMTISFAGSAISTIFSALNITGSAVIDTIVAIGASIASTLAAIVAALSTSPFTTAEGIRIGVILGSFVISMIGIVTQAQELVAIGNVALQGVNVMMEGIRRF